MKKSMAKVLAGALSLAMAVTLVTPSNAAAASKPKFSKTYSNVYSGTSAAYTVKNVKKGYKVKVSVAGTAKSAVKLSKSTIKVTGKTAKFTAKFTASASTANKGATVTAVVYNTKGKKVKTLKDGIRIKAHATAISLSAPSETVGLNADTQITTTLTPAYATDAVTYSVEPAEGATVSSTGVFNATKVGEYKVTATVNGITSEAVTVKAQAQMKTVTLTKPNTVEITFDTDMSAAKPAVNKDNIKVTNKDASTVQPVKSVSLSKDGTKATVETFSNFVNDKNYEVTYNGQTLSLTAKIGDPASVVVSSKSIKINNETDIDFKVLDANGVELSDKKSNVTFEAKDANGNDKGFISGSKITLFNVGDTVQVTGTYHTGKYENGKEITFKSEPATYTAVEKLDVSGTITAYTLSDKKQISKVNFESPDKYLFVDGKAETLVVKGKDANGKDINSLDNEGFTFETADDSIAIVNGQEIKGVKEGTAYIKVTYGTSSTVVELTVAKKAIVSSIAVDKTNITLSNGVKDNSGTPSVATDDAINVKVTVKDQFGQKMDMSASDIEVSKNKKSDKYNLKSVTPGNNEVTFVADSNTEKGDYTYELSCGEVGKKLTARVDVKVVAPTSNEVTSYRVQLSSNEIDTAVNSDTNASDAISDVTVKASIVGYNGDGVKVVKDTPDKFNCHIRFIKDNATVTSGTGVSFKVRRNSGATSTTGGSITKDLSTGTYKVSAFTSPDAITAKANQIKVGDKFVDCAYDYLTVKDSQDGGNVVVKENSFKASDFGSSVSYAAILKKAAKHVKVYTSEEVGFADGEITYVTVDGKDGKVPASETVSLTGTGKKQIYIGNVVVNETIKINEYTFTVPVTYTVNRTFTITE